VTSCSMHGISHRSSSNSGSLFVAEHWTVLKEYIYLVDRSLTQTEVLLAGKTSDSDSVGSMRAFSTSAMSSASVVDFVLGIHLSPRHQRGDS
jgi:hypothetical protein